MTRPSYLLSMLAALMGAAGVVLAAAAAHSGGGNAETAAPFQILHTAALFLILHAAALLGLAGSIAQMARHRLQRILILCSFGLGIAVILFCADLATRALASSRLFPLAAPIGGTGMILFWLALAGTFACAAVKHDG
jgi:uncharacterized membrane protein YgdD (TMEM256/DUF423 family)